MQELYSSECVDYHHAKQIPSTKIIYMFDTETSKIDSEKFKELLVSMPEADQIYHNNRSFKIAKDNDSLRISFFDLSKKSNYRKEKHQLEKKLSIIRFIVKIHSDNFYVSAIRFGSRKKTRDIKQNFIRHEHIERFADKMATLLCYNYGFDLYSTYLATGIDERLISSDLKKEIGKISGILHSELGAVTTAKALTEPTKIGEIKQYFVDLLTGVILEWFCRKNKIKVDYFWLTKLISTQYMTKKQLKNYDNNYLKAFLDYYKLTPAVVPHIKGMIKSYMDNTLSFCALSIYEKIYPLGEYAFNFESSIVDVSMDIAKKRRLISVNPYINNIYNLSDLQDREKFGEFLNYLSENRKAFHKYVVTDKAYNLGSFISCLAKLYRMGVVFDFNYIPDIMHDPTKLLNLIDGVDYLVDQSNSFVVQHYDKKYKEKVESVFTLYGVKWSVKLHTKPIVSKSHFYGDSISHNSSVILTEVKTGEFLEINVINPNAKKFIKMILPSKSLAKFLKNRGKAIEYNEKFGIPKELGSKFQEYSGELKPISRKNPKDNAEPLWALHKVYNTFYENSRYFGVDNQILYPILGSVIKNNETLNKYTKPKSVTV